ncbi:MAG: flavodoxin family protein [Candidatus Atribacteria bacterium]|nr:flavodoxin family protein [Candidatus Atribacteria bacterium]
MKVLVIYNSVHHGNTEKIAKVIADELKAKMVKPTEEEVNKLSEYDLIGFGSGIYMGKHHESIFQLLEKLPAVKDKKAFVFCTSGSSKNYNGPLKEKLTAKGFQVVGEFSCKGFDTYGPFKLIGGINKGWPNEEDCRKAQEFAHNFLK